MILRQFFLLSLSLMTILFSANTLHAQTDYIITLQQDTMYGDITIWGELLGRNLTLKTANGKKKINKDRIYEYKRNKHTFMFVRIPGKKGRTYVYRSVVIMFGEIRLLEEMAEEAAAYFVQYEGNFYQINRKYFSDDIWSILIQCPSFSDKFGTYKQETEHKRMMFFPK